MGTADAAEAEAPEPAMEYGFMARPYASLAGVGEISNLWLGYEFGAVPLQLHADAGPIVLAVGSANPAGASTSYWAPASLTASFSSRWLAVGVGGTAAYEVVRCNGQSCPGAPVFAIAESLRLGDEDWFYLSWRSAVGISGGHLSLEFFQTEFHTQFASGGLFLEVAGGFGPYDQSSFGLALVGGDFRVGEEKGPTMSVGLGVAETEVFVCGGRDCVGALLWGLALGFGMSWR